MLRIIAILFGIALLTLGILGFIPNFTPNNFLFGIFQIGFWNNVFLIAIGVIALLCGITSNMSAKIYFIVVGLLFAALAVTGFIRGPGVLLGLLQVNTPDNLAHAFLSVLCLYFGFFLKSKS